jgi:hypothetical protein
MSHLAVRLAVRLVVRGATRSGYATTNVNERDTP